MNKVVHKIRRIHALVALPFVTERTRLNMLLVIGLWSCIV